MRAVGGRCLMHHLLGAVHEASVQLSELPIGDVTAALLHVLQESGEDVSGSQPGFLDPLAHDTGSLTVSRSRRKRMLGTR